MYKMRLTPPALQKSHYFLINFLFLFKIYCSCYFAASSENRDECINRFSATSRKVVRKTKKFKTAQHYKEACRLVGCEVANLRSNSVRIVVRLQCIDYTNNRFDIGIMASK